MAAAPVEQDVVDEVNMLNMAVGSGNQYGEFPFKLSLLKLFFAGQRVIDRRTCRTQHIRAIWVDIDLIASDRAFVQELVECAPNITTLITPLTCNFLTYLGETKCGPVKVEVEGAEPTFKFPDWLLTKIVITNGCPGVRNDMSGIPFRFRRTVTEIIFLSNVPLTNALPVFASLGPADEAARSTAENIVEDTKVPYCNACVRISQLEGKLNKFRAEREKAERMYSQKIVDESKHKEALDALTSELAQMENKQYELADLMKKAKNIQQMAVAGQRTPMRQLDLLEIPYSWIIDVTFKAKFEIHIGQNVKCLAVSSSASADGTIEVATFTQLVDFFASNKMSEEHRIVGGRMTSSDWSSVIPPLLSFTDVEGHSGAVVAKIEEYRRKTGDHSGRKLALGAFDTRQQTDKRNVFIDAIKKLWGTISRMPEHVKHPQITLNSVDFLTPGHAGSCIVAAPNSWKVYDFHRIRYAYTRPHVDTTWTIVGCCKTAAAVPPVAGGRHVANVVDVAEFTFPAASVPAASRFLSRERPGVPVKEPAAAGGTGDGSAFVTTAFNHDRERVSKRPNRASAAAGSADVRRRVKPRTTTPASMHPGAAGGGESPAAAGGGELPHRTEDTKEQADWKIRVKTEPGLTTAEYVNAMEKGWTTNEELPDLRRSEVVQAMYRDRRLPRSEDLEPGRE